jgi:hypothetical protein
MALTLPRAGRVAKVWARALTQGRRTGLAGPGYDDQGCGNGRRAEWQEARDILRILSWRAARISSIIKQQYVYL